MRAEVPLGSVRGGARPAAPHAAARGDVAGLWSGQEAAGVGGHRQGQEATQRDPVEAPGQEQPSAQTGHGQRHRLVDRLAHARA